MIRLFTTFYKESNPYRAIELKTALKINISLNEITEIHVLNEGADLTFLKEQLKINIFPIKSRPTYSQFFTLINTITKPSDINIIANTDIYFDYNIGVLNKIIFNKSCLALARWDVQPDLSCLLLNRNDSQDTWIFKGKINENVIGNYHLGVPRCDNRLLYELQLAGYNVLNPAYSIKSYHLHLGLRSDYTTENLKNFIAPPYRYKYPHNYFSFLKTILFNLKNNYKLGLYVYDRKKINNWIILRICRKIFEKVGIKFPLIGY